MSKRTDALQETILASMAAGDRNAASLASFREHVAAAAADRPTMVLVFDVYTGWRWIGTRDDIERAVRLMERAGVAWSPLDGSLIVARRR